MEREIVIDYYTDVLCIWAWIAQRRIDELDERFGDRIAWRYHYVDIFGDTAGKMKRQWSERGLFEGFGQHVMEAASNYQDAPVNPDIWTRVRPTTSGNAHLFLKAVEQCYSAEESKALALVIREAFFVNAVDISDQKSLLKIAANSGLDQTEITRRIESGSPIAALLGDYQSAKELAIKGSPSFVMDGGRQTLYGNVGYRVLNANVEELQNRPSEEASWC
jgi:predicted DsbA family dithiol-disulfide isomerase